MMLRLAILLHSKSPAAYKLLRDTNVLRLPGESTLYNYTSAIHPKTGFNVEVLDDIKRTTEKFDDNKRFIVLMHDEMSIKEDLVFDRKTGEMIGFINHDKWEEGDCEEKLATHVLVFYIVGVNSNLKASLGFFGTQTATADELFPLFWQAIGYLENYCQLKVIASTSGKAPQNQTLYQLHDTDQGICYKTINQFATDRYIYFFSDVPHLIKTVRNNLASSSFGSTSRLLWNQGQYLLWKHIFDVYMKESECQLYRTKLTSEHVQLTSYSRMNVKLAAQVLSSTVGKVMAEYGGSDCQETARFILLMDKFFDCLNTRSLVEGQQKRKPEMLPYYDINDERFEWLQHGFLAYLESWQVSTQARPGLFTQAERNRLFLSQQTYKELVMTVRAFVEVARYLLLHGVEYILSNKFCQDPLEEHFGRHRSLGHRSDNPNLYSFGHQENKIRMQRTLAVAMQPRGNVHEKKKLGLIS